MCSATKGYNSIIGAPLSPISKMKGVQIFDHIISNVLLVLIPYIYPKWMLELSV